MDGNYLLRLSSQNSVAFFKSLMRLQLPLSLGKLALVSSIGLCAATFSGGSAQAAEEVFFKYQSLTESLTVQEIRDFAVSGKASPKLEVYLRLSKANANEIRQTLTREMNVSAKDVQQFLDSWVGKLTMDEVSQIVRPINRQSSKRALRSAIDASVKDNKLSLLEVFQNYPAPKVEVDVDRWLATEKRINTPR